jgi:hypothetical protein
VIGGLLAKTLPLLNVHKCYEDEARNISVHLFGILKPSSEILEKTLTGADREKGVISWGETY